MKGRTIGAESQWWAAVRIKQKKGEARTATGQEGSVVLGTSIGIVNSAELTVALGR